MGCRIRLQQRVPVGRRLLDDRRGDGAATARARLDDERLAGVLADLLVDMRCSVSELAPGVKGITTVMGRDESSSAAASCIVAPLAANAARRTTDGRNICVSGWERVSAARARRT
jgi:hypothetical protein